MTIPYPVDTDTSGAQRIAGLFAAPPTQEDSSFEQSSKAAGSASALTAAKVGRDAEGFVRAGWSFSEDCADDSCLRVYRLPNGHIGLAGKVLNVKFAAGVSAAEIDNLLAKFDMRKRRALAFAKNLMMVELQKTGDTDPFSVSAQLASDPRVEFAEPVVLEQIEHR